MGKGSKVKENLMTRSIIKLVAWGELGKNQKKMGTSFMDVPIYTIGDEDCSNEITIEFYLPNFKNNGEICYDMNIHIRLEQF